MLCVLCGQETSNKIGTTPLCITHTETPMEIAQTIWNKKVARDVGSISFLGQVVRIDQLAGRHSGTVTIHSIIIRWEYTESTGHTSFQVQGLA